MAGRGIIQRRSRPTVRERRPPKVPVLGRGRRPGGGLGRPRTWAALFARCPAMSGLPPTNRSGPRGWNRLRHTSAIAARRALGRGRNRPLLRKTRGGRGGEVVDHLGRVLKELLLLLHRRLLHLNHFLQGARFVLHALAARIRRSEAFLDDLVLLLERVLELQDPVLGIL